MQALLVICRASLESHVLVCLEQANVTAFSWIERVSGTGVTGQAPMPWTPPNSLFLVVLPQDRASEVAAQLYALGARLREAHGAEVPLRVFGFRCEALV